MLRIHAIAGDGKQQDSWSSAIAEGSVLCIGRAPRDGFAVAWDPRISREHAEVRWQDGVCYLSKLGTALNPVLLAGEACDRFELTEGTRFQIGATNFKVYGPEHDDGLLEYRYDRDDLQAASFANAEECLDLLSRLPVLMEQAANDKDLLLRSMSLLLQGIPRAAAVAIIQLPQAGLSDEHQALFFQYQVRESDFGTFSPSKRLVNRAAQQGEATLHFWGDKPVVGGIETSFTMTEKIQWAYCVPFGSNEQTPWCVYVAGASGGYKRREELRPDIKFTEIISHFLSAFIDISQLNRTRSQLGRFFSPAVLETLATAQTIEPTEQEISVLFCDLRGFTRMTDQGGDLHALLDRVGTALSVMTRAVMQHEGAIADFQGDAVLAFWGWPQEQAMGPVAAARAALAMYRQFAQPAPEQAAHLDGLQVGIGIGFGHAIAGQIGSEEQVKVGVFGPVVNRTSRLESLTKYVGVPILLDEAAAQVVQAEAPEFEMQVRRIAPVLLQGLRKPVMVYELFAADNTAACYHVEHRTAYATALAGFIAGDWVAALAWCQDQATVDPAAAALANYMTSYAGTPPNDWPGYMRMDHK